MVDKKRTPDRDYGERRGIKSKLSFMGVHNQLVVQHALLVALGAEPAVVFTS